MSRERARPTDCLSSPVYILITPAHNEEDFIEKTIESVVAQTARPLKWVIVDDGSTDKTAAIADDWASRHPFIEVIKLKRDNQRSFARKAHAFAEGLKIVEELPFEFIGNVDADMSFAPDYFENILKDFEVDPKLGIGGGIVYTKFTKEFVTYDNTEDSVGGKVQLFRRQCFYDVGGYLPLKYGGIDTAAEVIARMKGWVVRKSFKFPAYEHRRTSFSWGGPVKAKIKEGAHFHSLGYDPLFYFFRCMYRLAEYPFLIGSLAALYGYIKCTIIRREIVLPPEVVSYLRAEQRAKLKRTLRLRSGQA